MISKRELIFTLCFAFIFIVAMVWSYRKDAMINNIHFKGVSKVLLLIIAAFVGIFIFVKTRH